MARQAKNSINLYEGYKQHITREKTDKSRRIAKLVVPLALMAAALLVFAGSIIIKNVGKAQEIAAINDRIAELTPAYTHAVEVSDECAARESEYDDLTLNRMLFNIYPVLSEALITRVRDCALDGEIFFIYAYSYDEADETLVINATADSVNEVPKFVERLRETLLFSGVHYTGYTSDQAAVYFCTVGCTLVPDEGADEEDGTVTSSAELNTTDDVDDAASDEPEDDDEPEEDDEPRTPLGQFQADTVKG